MSAVVKVKPACLLFCKLLHALAPPENRNGLVVQVSFEGSRGEDRAVLFSEQKAKGPLPLLLEVLSNEKIPLLCATPWKLVAGLLKEKPHSFLGAKSNEGPFLDKAGANDGVTLTAVDLSSFFIWAGAKDTLFDENTPLLGTNGDELTA